jgi:C4-dicarboxylate transporter
LTWFVRKTCEPQKVKNLEQTMLFSAVFCIFMHTSLKRSEKEKGWNVSEIAWGMAKKFHSNLTVIY